MVQYSSVVQGHCSLRTSPARVGPFGSQRCWPVTAGTEPAWYWHCQTPEWSASKTPHGLCGTPTAERGRRQQQLRVLEWRRGATGANKEILWGAVAGDIQQYWRSSSWDWVYIHVLPLTQPFLLLHMAISESKQMLITKNTFKACFFHIGSMQ